MKQHAPAAARNREPIREVLERELPPTGLVLEIASGSGEHAVAFARAFPALTWQPSDPSPTALASIAAHRDEAALPNLAAPIELDITQPIPLSHADAIVCINMVHIAPWDAALALFATAGLAQANPNPPVLIADHNEGAEIETASPFDDLGGTVDEDDLLGQLLP